MLKPRPPLVTILVLMSAILILQTGRCCGTALSRAHADQAESRVYLPLVLLPSLEADFAASPTVGLAPLTVVFTNTSTGDYTASRWDFGDSITGTLRNPTHTYATVGAYTVTLTVSTATLSDTLTRTNYITVTNTLQNGSFEEGWTDLPPEPGNLINQQPVGWTLSWVEIGELLYGSTDPAGGVPECVHKHNDQLPPQEQLGGADALVLDGSYTYKIFHFGAPFGAELTQTISPLAAGVSWRLTVPILVDLHDDTDPWGAESGVWVNGFGQWANAETMGHRNWYDHVVEFTPAAGQAEIVIRVKDKHAGKDFFIDNIRLEMVSNAGQSQDSARGSHR
ncbi:MAG: PKD domain-containing protein [Anaerolineales bacterium]|nr:PKD domain-containing protein [Anaerolineales bacterium]